MDEIQKVPALLDEVHSPMEREGYKKFVLTGSFARFLEVAALSAGTIVNTTTSKLVSKD